jgi:hypothetical protein
MERLVYASVWIQIIVEPGPVQMGRDASCSGNVPLATLLINTFSSAFVVLLGWGLRLDFTFEMKPELMEEKRPA